jgi:excisionase family DNA binding protein
MNFQKLLAELDAADDRYAETVAAGIVNDVSEWAAANGYPSLVRCETPAAQVIEVRRYLAECIATAAERSTVGPYSVAQVAEQLGVDDGTVVAWIKSGKLKGANIGKGQQRGRYRIQAGALEAFLASRQPEPPTPASQTPRKKPSTKNYRS